MSDNNRLATMNIIQNQRAREIERETQPPLDDEGKALAEYKRNAFDYPVNAVKVDPLR